MSHGLSLVPRVCVCDLLCCRTHAFNSCCSDLIAWLCEGLCGRVWGETGTVSFLHRPEVSRGGQIGVAGPRSSVAALWLCGCSRASLTTVVEGRRPFGRPLGETRRRHRWVRKPSRGCTAHERWRLRSRGVVWLRRVSSQALTSLRKRKSGSICVGPDGAGARAGPLWS